MSSFTIRPATGSDAEAMAVLSAELGYPAEPETIRARMDPILNLHDHLVIVAEDPSGAIIGWLQARAGTVLESGFRVEIVGLIVTHAARGQGLGRALVTTAERWAAGISAETVVVRTNTQRAESHGFYAALGYAAVKTQMVYRKTLS